MPRSPIQNLKRRGAVYWWRRTVFLGCLAFSENLPISLEFSLFTKELDSARGRAAAMTAYSERLRMNFRENVAQYGLDEKTIATIYVEEVRSYRNELVHLEAAWKAHPVWSTISNRDDDLAMFEALWKGIADEGIGVPRDWAFVEKHFAKFDHEMQCRIRSLLRDQKDLPEHLRVAAQRRLEQAGLESNGLNIPVAVDVIARARAEAARRVRENADFADLARLASLATSFTTQAVPAASGARAAPCPEPPLGQLAGPLDPEASKYAAMSPTEFAEVFIRDRFGGLEERTGEKRQRQIVGDSTHRDIKWIARLLEKAMPEGMPFSQVTNEHVRMLDAWFDRLPTTIGKSPADHAPETTFEEIEERALQRVEDGDLSPDDIGLSINTSNKHWHNFARLHEHLRSLVPGLNPIPISKYITPQKKSAREARAKYTVEQGEAIFKLPPWTGCAGIDDRLSPGNRFFHDALYYVLLLVWYTGARREEICKLQLDDVSTDADVPHIYIRETSTGRIKSLNAKRKIPLHSELIRLGLIKYVEAMRAAEEKLMFPEIYPADGTKRAIGDVFYKVWWVHVRPFVPNLQRGQAMHSARHTGSDALKQAGVDLEARNDLLGHSQTDLGEGASTYPEPLALMRMKEMVELIPIVTGHLSDVTKVNLLPKERRVGRPKRKRKQ